jgi:hypothetical protein
MTDSSLSSHPMLYEAFLTTGCPPSRARRQL